MNLINISARRKNYKINLTWHFHLSQAREVVALELCTILVFQESKLSLYTYAAATLSFLPFVMLDKYIGLCPGGPYLSGWPHQVGSCICRAPVHWLDGRESYCVFFFINRPRVPSLCKFLYSSIYNQPTIVSLLSWNHETGNLRLTFRYLNPSAPLLLRCCLYCCGLTAPPSPIKHRSLNDLCCQSWRPLHPYLPLPSRLSALPRRNKAPP